MRRAWGPTPRPPSNSVRTRVVRISPQRLAWRVRPGDSVTFNASSSSDPDGMIRSYIWDFGDGSAGNGTVVQHRYGQAGTFRVLLTVVDGQGATDSATSYIVVSVTHPPVAAFSA